ncbi:hypothetical protein SAICODRAFT_21642 [Saitoella complicata NRRL Y-17804]|uniref:VPS9 domain-containing protein n=1 Tax=Saitoella complicata (strain BCRC 22490 / CBS 7301 / JCM 7358 / NBRC 10748 / NRRL Y-17804) TaxID=698492 RepID=A0A0E9NNZ9_SAICN|nr:uncharacterized protein SAICODRAFT_21642 [Saitoella complicata NRRL Y-17804]ODQ50402.1 hypothetical protein SAICODRAFT_21642 [Saitoella complicata NRRL Y-17804]GAO51155.1 hypothetical protein G7K_5266-t1 [Saitoella complicata NRRL Y-17804]
MPNPNAFLKALLEPDPKDKRIRDLLAQCQNHPGPGGVVILCPVAESLAGWDRESGLEWAALMTEEFLASHVLRASALPQGSTRHRPRQYTTLNGRTVIIKEDHVYGHKGFQTLHRAKLLSDDLIPSSPHGQSASLRSTPPVLVYYLDRPLIGSPSDWSARPWRPRKLRTFTTFGELLDAYPAISRQLEPGLVTLFKHFNDFQLEKHLDHPPSEGDNEDEEDALVRKVEDVTNAAVELFKGVDDGAVSQLVHTSSVTGEGIERLIEKFVSERAHDYLFLRLAHLHRHQDQALREAIEAARGVDVGQVGVPVVDGEVRARLGRAVGRFDGIRAARTAVEKLEILVDVLVILTHAQQRDPHTEAEVSEKPRLGALVSADYLIPLMLLVVLRCNVDHLDTTLAYMRKFSLGDTGHGEWAYALSTLEAVFFYILENKDKLAGVGRVNEEYWTAVREGRVGRWRESWNDGEISLESVARSQNGRGESAVMQAVKAGSEESLSSLAGWGELATGFWVTDVDERGMTPLAEAVQREEPGLVRLILSRILPRATKSELRRYLAYADFTKRTVAHCIVNMPWLIDEVGELLPWGARDQNGQTPLYTLCTMYDHTEYRTMVLSAIRALRASKGGREVRLVDHRDGVKGNTLLHIIRDVDCLRELLKAEGEVNAPNAKSLPALLNFAKNGRVDLLRVFFESERVDRWVRDRKGMTVVHMCGSMEVLEFLCARGEMGMSVDVRDWRGVRPVEVCKDDGMRERFDELSLWARPVIQERCTAILRVTVLEDASVRFLIKSGIPNDSASTTAVWRSYGDFQFLLDRLRQENPDSWFPALPRNIPNPCLLPSKPSRSLLNMLSLHLTAFLHALLRHSTLCSHELLWEFILIPELQYGLILERTKENTAVSKEEIWANWTPAEGEAELGVIETWYEHSRGQMEELEEGWERVDGGLRRVWEVRKRISTATRIGAKTLGGLSELGFLGKDGHIAALQHMATELSNDDSTPYDDLLALLSSITSTNTGLLSALTHRPRQLLDTIRTASSLASRTEATIRRTPRLPLSLFGTIQDETRHRLEIKVREARREAGRAGSELGFAHARVAGEMSCVWKERGGEGVEGLKAFVRGVVRGERARLRGMKKALEMIGGRTVMMKARDSNPTIEFEREEGGELLIDLDKVVDGDGEASPGDVELETARGFAEEAPHVADSFPVMIPNGHNHDPGMATWAPWKRLE